MKLSPHSRTLVFLTLYGVGLGSILNMTFAPLALWALGHGGGPLGAGAMTTLFTWAAVACRPLLAPWLDKKGRSLVLRIGTLVLLVATILLALDQSLALGLALRVVQGLAMAAVSLAAATLVADWADPPKLGSATAKYLFGFALSSLVVPTWAISWAEHGWWNGLWAVAITVLGALLVLSFLIHDTKTRTASRSKRGFWEASAIPASILQLLAAFGVGILVTFLVPWARTRQLPGIEWFYFVNSAALLGVRGFAGALLRRWSLRTILTVAGLFLMVSWIFAALSFGPFLFFSFAILNGIGFGLLQPVLNTLVIQKCSDDRRGRANALLLSAMDAGVGLGALAGGVLAQSQSWDLVIVVSAGLSVLVFIGTAVLDTRPRSA